MTTKHAIRDMLKKGSPFADDFFKLIFWYEKCILLQISIKFLANGACNNKPLSEAAMV